MILSIVTWAGINNIQTHSRGVSDNLDSGIAIDSSGSVYVAGDGNNRIRKSDSNGKFITKWGSAGTEDGQFNNPTDVAVDPSGHVYKYFLHHR